MLPRSSAHKPGQVIDHVARVVFNSVNEARLAAPEYWQPERIQPWGVDDTAFVTQVPFLIDHRHT